MSADLSCGFFPALSEACEGPGGKQLFKYPFLKEPASEDSSPVCSWCLCWSFLFVAKDFAALIYESRTRCKRLACLSFFGQTVPGKRTCTVKQNKC